MLIGVLSDSHDEYDRTKRAVELLLSLGAQALIHCGDICEPRMLDLLVAGLDVPSYFVFGNNDYDRKGLETAAEHLGLHCLGTHGIVELAAVKIGVTHGDRRAPLTELEATPNLRWLLTGHTHIPHDEQSGTLRRVNPGALHRTRSPSVCTIDLKNDAVLFRRV